MRRRLFEILSIISLLLCLAVGALWWRSYLVQDVWQGPDDGILPALSFKPYGGRIQIAWGLVPFQYHVGWYHSYTLGFYEKTPFEFEFYSYDPFSRYLPGSKTIQIVRFPLLLPMLFFAVAPTFWLLGVRARRGQRRLGLCAQCGYDLRASGERCPECGAVKPSESGRRQLS